VSDRDPKFTNAFWMHFSRKVGMKLKFSTAFHSQMVGKNRACEPIIEELGGCGPTRLGALCGSSGVWLQCSHALGDQGVVFRGGLWSALQPTNLALKGVHSTLEFYHDGKDLA
jgi:hypothetical protein